MIYSSLCNYSFNFKGKLFQKLKVVLLLAEKDFLLKAWKELRHFPKIRVLCVSLQSLLTLYFLLTQFLYLKQVKTIIALTRPASLSEEKSPAPLARTQNNSSHLQGSALDRSKLKRAFINRASMVVILSNYGKRMAYKDPFLLDKVSLF